MRPAPNALVEMYRQAVPGGRTAAAGNNGCFLIPFGKRRLAVIASDEAGWDHVSVSLPDRTPSWEEMCHVRELFFRADEWVMQLHPPKLVNINNHQFCLHLWRPQTCAVPTPPAWMVGMPGVSHEEMARLSPDERRRLVDRLARQASL
jgi:hypothetical protein